MGQDKESIIFIQWWLLSTKVFIAKFDTKVSFWRLNCKQGKERKFSYILLQPPGQPTKLVVTTSLQIGWAELPPTPYFCAASKTSYNVEAM
jgi:hypothetical protein